MVTFKTLYKVMRIKMKSFKYFTLFIYGALSFTSYSNELTINNSNIDVQNASDGEVISVVQGWEALSGSSGLFNPPETVFIGEAGDGVHKNTLFLHHSAAASQTLNHSLKANTSYKLEFDVGERLDNTLSNYLVSIKAGIYTIHQLSNPVVPAEKGTFARVTVDFFTDGITGVGDLIVLELETIGTGQVHFDNFSLTELGDVTSTSETTKFGEWQHTTHGTANFKRNTIYQSDADGFIQAFNHGNCLNNSFSLEIGDSPTNLTWITRMGNYTSLFSPMEKDSYWKISGPTNTSCTVEIGFMPLL